MDAAVLARPVVAPAVVPAVADVRMRPLDSMTTIEEARKAVVTVPAEIRGPMATVTGAQGANITTTERAIALHRVGRLQWKTIRRLAAAMTIRIDGIMLPLPPTLTPTVANMTDRLVISPLASLLIRLAMVILANMIAADGTDDWPLNNPASELFVVQRIWIGLGGQRFGAFAASRFFRNEVHHDDTLSGRLDWARRNNSRKCPTLMMLP